MSLSDKAEELVLFTDNDSRMYNRRKPFLDNMRRKIKNGKYDHKKAPQLWLYFVKEAVDCYGKEVYHSDNGVKLARTMFPISVRKEVAAYYAKEAYREIKEG